MRKELNRKKAQRGVLRYAKCKMPSRKVSEYIKPVVRYTYLDLKELKECV